MSRMFDRIEEQVGRAVREALEEEIPHDLDTYDDDMQELEELRAERDKREEKEEEHEAALKDQKKKYEEMLCDLIKSNLHQAILSPFAEVRELALVVARDIVAARRAEEDRIVAEAV